MTAIELAQPRIIPINDRNRLYTLTVGVITKQQWQRYFEGIVSTSENTAGTVVESYDSQSSRIELVQNALTDATGYAVPGDAAIASIANWQSLIPMSHRLAAANVLVSVAADAPDDDDPPLGLGIEIVMLRARWGADDSGNLQEFRGLVHRFRTPSAEHQRRYQRALSRAVITGASRSAQTRWIGAQNTLIELYDELIDGVEGYVNGGRELTGPPEIVAAMDGYHKVVAAERLFTPAVPKLSEAK